MHDKDDLPINIQEIAEKLRRIERMNAQIRTAAEQLVVAGMADNVEKAEAIFRSALLSPTRLNSDRNGDGLASSILEEFKDGVRTGPLPDFKVEDGEEYNRHNKRPHKKRHHSKKSRR